MNLCWNYISICDIFSFKLTHSNTILKNINCSNEPVLMGGSLPIYSTIDCPVLIFVPGIFPTSQCSHSRFLGNFLLGASGSFYFKNSLIIKINKKKKFFFSHLKT